MSRTILVVEDESDLAFLLRRNLEAEGYIVDVAGDGDVAAGLIAHGRYQLVLLDLMLPRRSGLELLKMIRAQEQPAPVIILTARSSVAERVEGLRLGADDYIGKPFDMAELLARVEAVLRRQGEDLPPTSAWIGDVMVDFEQMSAHRGSQEIVLSSRELRVLRTLAARRGQVVTRQELLRAAWSPDEAVSERTVDAHIKNLRKKLEADPTRPVYLRTVQREGYVLVQSNAPE